MIVVISEPIRQLRDYFDDRRQAIYTDSTNGQFVLFPSSRAILKGVHQVWDLPLWGGGLVDQV